MELFGRWNWWLPPGVARVFRVKPSPLRTEVTSGDRAPAVVKFARVELEVVEGDIAELDVDAIANAANNHLWMGAGVAGAIKREGGERDRGRSDGAGPGRGRRGRGHGRRQPQGKERHSRRCEGQDLRTNAKLVAHTTRRVLEAADELGARSVALPAFGTGVGGFPLAEAAEIIVREAGSYEPRNLQRVVFAVFGDEAEEAFRRALDAVER